MLTSCLKSLQKPLVCHIILNPPLARFLLLEKRKKKKEYKYSNRIYIYKLKAPKIRIIGFQIVRIT
jgi:hypothetical protein